MKYFSLVFLFSLLNFVSFSQETKKKYYWSNANELIFSYGMVEDTAGKQVNSTLRFSGFLNSQKIFNYDFGKTFGIYTGLGVRNVGLITHPNSIDTSGVTRKIKVKQRAFGLAVPLAIKIGKMEKRNYLALGAEAEYFFNYKQKLYYNGEKHKSNEWFPDQVNAFNPSVFLEYQSGGFFIRAKYYLLDFLTPGDNLEIDKYQSVPGYSKSSKLFYISIGVNIKGGGGKDAYKNVMPKKPTA